MPTNANATVRGQAKTNLGVYCKHWLFICIILWHFINRYKQHIYCQVNVTQWHCMCTLYIFIKYRRCIKIYFNNLHHTDCQCACSFICNLWVMEQMLYNIAFQWLLVFLYSFVLLSVNAAKSSEIFYTITEIRYTMKCNHYWLVFSVTLRIIWKKYFFYNICLTIIWNISFSKSLTFVHHTSKLQ